MGERRPRLEVRLTPEEQALFALIAPSRGGRRPGHVHGGMGWSGLFHRAMSRYAESVRAAADAIIRQQSNHAITINDAIELARNEPVVRELVRLHGENEYHE